VTAQRRFATAIFESAPVGGRGKTEAPVRLPRVKALAWAHTSTVAHSGSMVKHRAYRVGFVTYGTFKL
jgi:hypothetical protein